MARKIERLTYTNERGESVEFSHVSTYHTNMYDVSGLADVRNAIYSISSMGQDGDTYLGNRIESREIEITREHQRAGQGEKPGTAPEAKPYFKPAPGGNLNIRIRGFSARD